MPPEQELEFIIAIAYLGDLRGHLKQWMIYYQELPETDIAISDPRDIVT